MIKPASLPVRRTWLLCVNRWWSSSHMNYVDDCTLCSKVKRV